jgi:hypothetical protein
MAFSGTWPLLLAMLGATVGVLWWRWKWAGPSSKTPTSSRALQHAVVIERSEKPRRGGSVGSR